MKRIAVKLDQGGIAEILKSSEMKEMVNGAAERMGSIVRSGVPADAKVIVRPYLTDRAAAAVVIADKRGMTLQARTGVLTKAATSIGAEVKVSKDSILAAR